jgi:hypothetical protein
MPDWRMKGNYLKNCNCVPSCPCDTYGYPAPHEFCEGVVAMDITEGNSDGVDLTGAKWAAAVHWPKALHDGNGTAEIFIDEGTSPEQREALGQILSGQAGGPLFEILSQIVTTFHGPHFVPIDFEFDKDSRNAKLSIEGFIETTSEPLKIPATEDEQRVIVRMPNGFEYQEMEVAQTGTLKSTGEIKFDWSGTHSSLAEVDHRPDGVAA